MERKELAEWLTAENNPYFAQALVNRLWAQLMGRGLVHPVDDFRATNPASHPQLLELLARDFIANGTSLKKTLREIVLSDSYARSSMANPDNYQDTTFYSYAKPRRLAPEILNQAIDDVLGIEQSVQPAPKPAPTSLLAQQLDLLNGRTLNARIMNQTDSYLDTLRKQNKTPAEIVEAFYLRAYARVPRSEELKHWLSLANDSESSLTFYQDFLWGLLASDEFKTNH